MVLKDDNYAYNTQDACMLAYNRLYSWHICSDLSVINYEKHLRKNCETLLNNSNNTAHLALARKMQSLYK